MKTSRHQGEVTLLACRSAKQRAILAGGVVLAALIVGCASQSERNQEGAGTAAAVSPESLLQEQAAAPFATEAAAAVDAVAGLEPQIYRGSGNFVNLDAVPGDSGVAGVASGGATLNFEGAEIREVAQLILGETLQSNYLVDPNVRGSITLRTSEALGREALLSVLEMVLQVNGAALLYSDGLYRIVPLAGALMGAGAPGVGTRPTNAGYQARIIPLRFIAAQEMTRILAPFFSTESVMHADSTRNLLMVAGTGVELNQIGQLVELFDVDMLSGMSVGVFPLHNVDAPTVEADLRELLSVEQGGALEGVVRLVPIERLNALMVVTPQSGYLDVLRTWIERLDVATQGGGRRLYVYRVQNVRAANLATILRELFSIEQTREGATPPELAPGATPRLIRTRPDETAAESAAAVQAVGVIQGAGLIESLSESPADAEDDNADAGTVGNVSIIADESTNALVILANTGDYARIESAIRQLDVMPLQVLLETTIVEVSLNGELSYGMQWFFDHNTGEGAAGMGSVGLPLAFPGTLSYSIVNAADEVRAVLRLLATEDKVQVVSAPSVLVMDNQTANIRVGNQQPVSTSIITEGGVVSTSVQFKNTGITLDVTPRVNASGLVTLEINQELTDVGQIDDATGQRAFLQRSIGSNVAVQSGQSVVLGGLIRENDTTSRSGVPFLHKIPVIGNLFGQTVNTNDRTELLVLLTATVIETAKDSQDLIEAFRVKMPSLFPIPSGFSPQSLSEDAVTESAEDTAADQAQSDPEPVASAAEPEPATS